MDIFNQPPSISEDTLQYILYSGHDVSDRASVTTLATLMQQYVDSLLPEFLWHRDAFELKVVKNPDGDGWILEGRMRVGDCVDDEWCAVWLLRSISEKWDVVISAFDSDGEFLLIEAAESLPSWVTPSNAENRVWIYHSRLHLIPLSHVSSPSSKPRRRRYPGARESDDEGDIAGDVQDEDYISVQDALRIVRDPLVDTLAPSQVEETVWQRISRYPAAARQHVHVTKAYLPVDVAKALAVDPSLVQKPVETFYTRDALQLRAAHKMSRFPPEPSVLTSIKMTRTAYAQLVGQKFHPPKIFGRWQEREGTKEWRWRDVGMKLACGFEMLYKESKGHTDTTTIATDGSHSASEARKEALRRNSDYVTYIQKLVASGYFKGELEGSKLWNELEDKASSAFLEVRKEDDSTRSSFAVAVAAALSKSRAGNIALPEQDEDPDDWLNVNAEDFETMLEQNFGRKSQTPGGSANAMDIDHEKPSTESEEDRVAKEQASRLQDLAKKVESFVEGEGDIEGARFSDEEFSDEEFSDDNDDDSPMSQDEADGDTSVPAQATDVARQAALDQLVPGLDPSEYGKMPPSFYSNSQRVAPTTLQNEMREDVSPEGPSRSTEQPRKRFIRPPIIPRDEYDGVDSDDDTDEEGGGADDDEEEDQPQVVGDVEINMEEEEDEFLEFARQALGMSDAQWNDLIRERKGRGGFAARSILTHLAYVPTRGTAENRLRVPSQQDDNAQASCSPAAGPRTNANPNLDSFEAVMQAMDAKLARSHTGTQEPIEQRPDKGKSKAREMPFSTNVDIEAAMDAELKATLENGLDGDEDEGELEQNLDYNLIKNFLESFKSQGGLSGPVGNLAGRLQPGWTLPRDQS
ncbi:SGT1-domain-containing protein [Wolfiporia cocos MD-104 SS10]|uniref:SGT1-domain-containing protein n=1 Tax=Wolfiporia cocos (strain MD-104) TaxID=742152 RepID=A0A2H3ITS2_WOLCO|nr:SGT1-domain-containing protein [Wolfiporia cocos MD-104 SS10]